MTYITNCEGYRIVFLFFGGDKVKKFRIVVSKIQRKEILIDAESEEQAVEKTKELYEAGEVRFETSEKANVNFHAKY